MTEAIVIKARLDAIIARQGQQPETADIRFLCDLLEQETAALDTGTRLWLAGESLSRIAAVFCQRSEALFATLEATAALRDPVAPDDLFRDLIRQSMHVDFTDLLQRTANPDRLYTAPTAPLLTVIDDRQAYLHDLEAAPLPTLDDITALASVEAVSEWSSAIAAALAPHNRLKLSALQSQLDLTLIELWLGVLFGGYHLEADGQAFYGRDLWVSRTLPTSASNFPETENERDHKRL